MALEELDELLNSFAEADRPAMRDSLARNPAAAAALTSRETVYKAFVDGDPVKLASATAATAPAAVAASTTTSPAFDLAALDARLDARVNAIYESPAFKTKVESEATAIAQRILDAERPKLIGQGAEIADTIASIREDHLSEFHEPLDSAKFKDFFAANGSHYGNSLRSAYDGFVGEKRTDAKIKKGIEEGLAAKATTNVPGTSLPATDTPLRNFIDFNVKKSGGTSPTADADDAARAFNSMRSGWTN